MSPKHIICLSNEANEFQSKWRWIVAVESKALKALNIYRVSYRFSCISRHLFGNKTSNCSNCHFPKHKKEIFPFRWENNGKCSPPFLSSFNWTQENHRSRSRRNLILLFWPLAHAQTLFSPVAANVIIIRTSWLSSGFVEGPQDKEARRIKKERKAKIRGLANTILSPISRSKRREIAPGPVLKLSQIAK